MIDPIIRPYRPTDRANCYEVCVRTAAAAGGVARDLNSSDALMQLPSRGPYLDAAVMGIRKS